MVKKTKKTTLVNESKLQERVEGLQKRIEAAEESAKRALADYQNLDRRTREAETNIVKFANATLIEKILNSLDQLEMAQVHLQDKGLQMVIDHLLSILCGEGLQIIKSDGQTFDPLKMDCVEVVPGEKDQVIKTLSTGYFLHDRVIRPAKVHVGSGEKCEISK